MQRRSAFALLALVLTVGLTAVACGGQSTLPDTRASCAAPFRPGWPAQLPARPGWIITAGALARLRQAGLSDQLFQADFDRPSTLVLVSQGKPDSLVPDASPALYFTSAAAMVAALRANQVPPTVKYLLLDLERWPLTPVSEQRDPIGTLKWAAPVVHAYDRCLVFAPAVDLVGVQYPGARGQGLYSLFDSSIVGPGAALADVFVVQSQHSEGTRYAGSLAPQAIRAARAAHRVPVLAGLSTNPNGRRVSAADLLAVYRASMLGGSAGFWLNIPQTDAECSRCGMPQPQVAVAFLRAVAQITATKLSQ
jgi:hypothetical protein